LEEKEEEEKVMGMGALDYFKIGLKLIAISILVMVVWYIAYITVMAVGDIAPGVAMVMGAALIAVMVAVSGYVAFKLWKWK
jgi:hypothetical protein